MENTRRIFRIVTALIALAVVAAMCVLLVACDPEGKEGGETAAGGGDAIFTEDATLAGILEKLAAADSFTLEQRYDEGIPGEEAESVYAYHLVPQMVWFTGTYCTLDVDGITLLKHHYERYSYLSDDCIYSVFLEENGSIGAEKYSAQHAEEFYGTEARLGYWEQLSEYLTEKDGRIVFDEERMISESDDYVAGSGYVNLNGTSIEVGFETSGRGVGNYGVYAKKYIISGVNATTVTIPDYIKAAEKDAVWQEEF